MKRSLGARLFDTANVILLGIVAIITLFPLYYVFVVSFTDPVEYIQKQGFILFPAKWSFDSYKYLLSTSAFKNATLVSGFLATVGTALSLVITAALCLWTVTQTVDGAQNFNAHDFDYTLIQPGANSALLACSGSGLDQ